MDQIRPMNGPINLYSLEGFFCYFVFFSYNGDGGGKRFKKWFKMSENARKFH